jgi:type I restriction enzyme S subunit
VSEELPEGWAETSLGKCVEILDGQRVPVNSEERERRRGSIPYFGATGQVGWIDDYLFDEAILLLGEDGAPFLDKSKSIAYLVRGRSWVNNHAHVLKALACTSNSFLKYALDATDFEGYVSGTTRLKLTQGAMIRLPIRLPPLAEQRRIVEAVDTLLARVSAGRQRLNNVRLTLKRFRQSVLAAGFSGGLTEGWRMGEFDWAHATLGDLIQDGPQNGLYKPQSCYGRGIPIVRIDDFRGGLIRPASELKRLLADTSEVQKYELKEGDLLINRVNSAKFVGKSALAAPDHQGAVFESNMMRCRVNRERIDPRFALLYLLSPKGVSELQKNAKHAVNQSSINQDDVMEVDIPLPPLVEQVEMVRRATALFELANTIGRRVDTASVSADALTQSILAKALRGELVPTEAELARAEGRDYELAEALLARIQAERVSPPKGRRSAGRRAGAA